MAKTAAVGCPAEEKGRRKKESQFSQVLGRLRSNKMAMFGLAISLILIVLAIAAPLIMPYKYDQMDMANRFASPSLKHLCGTDEMGRDIFSRLYMAEGHLCFWGSPQQLFPLFWECSLALS